MPTFICRVGELAIGFQDLTFLVDIVFYCVHAQKNFLQFTEILFAAVLPVYYRDFTNIRFFPSLYQIKYPLMKESWEKAKAAHARFKLAILALRDKQVGNEIKLYSSESL